MDGRSPGSRRWLILVLVALLAVLCLALTTLISLAAAEMAPASDLSAAAPSTTKTKPAAPTATATPSPSGALASDGDALASTATATAAGTSAQAEALAGRVLFFPFLRKNPLPTSTPTPTPVICQPIPGASYGSLTVNGPRTDRPAEQHPDLNLALRGYARTNAYAGLVSYDGNPDPRAPQFPSLFADNRTPAFTASYRVYDWNWSANSRGSLISTWPVTLSGLRTAAGETIGLPRAGYDIGEGYGALVLYASESRLTLKYTREDNVVWGYTVHAENVCTDPALLNLYRSLNAAGRSRLPALRPGQPFGRARGTEIQVAVRDTGAFMDPRSRRDWWAGR